MVSQKASIATALRVNALAAAFGLLADAAFGEPPTSLHPVAWFGTLMQRVERQMWADRRQRGALYSLLGVGVAFTIGIGTMLGVGVGAVTFCSYVSVASRALADSARDVARALEEDDLEEARRLLPALVGRDPTGLASDEIARAVVESVAENTVDAVIAPLFWSVVAGAPGALVHRSLNTMDAMVGHRNARYRRFGWASAKLDDIAAWVPARLTAALVMLASPARAGEVLRTVRRDAKAHPSPNSGVSESAFAAALGVRLGGPSRYGSEVEMRPMLGDGRRVESKDIERTLRLAAKIDILSSLILLLIAAMPFGVRATRRTMDGRRCLDVS